MKWLYNDHKKYVRLRVIIIYTADVKRGSTDPVMDLGCGSIRIEEAFLSDFDPGKLWEELTSAVETGNYDDAVLMKLMIYPLTLKKMDEKIRAVAGAIDLAEKIEDRKRQVFSLTGICAFADKFIQDDDAERIRRLLNMTKVEQIYTREWMQRLNDELEKNNREIAMKLLRSGDSPEKVSECMNMPIETVRTLKEGLL